ncbi:hypothetical protein M8J76_013776 [Diaphorina citri]|nr:hypothetical protein M8J76_013776 [Diaphorina citri]
MFKLDADDKQELLKTDLICLYETWHTTEQQLPDFLCEDYSILEHSFAIKDKQVGRPSGGILIISKKNTITRIIEKTEYWIIVKYTLDNLKDLTLGIFYFKPSLDDAVVMELIEDALGSVRMEEKLLMCGDFNARISDLNFVEEEILIGTALNEERLSKDLKVNSRGRRLVELMENHGMIVLNGRINGDIPAQFTFVDTSGVSVVDLVWVSIEAAVDIKEMRVTDTPLHSDHLPLRIQLGEEAQDMSDTIQNLQSKEVEIYSWNEEKKKTFMKEIERNRTDNTSYYDLRQAVHKVSKKLGLVRIKKLGNRHTKINKDKKWFNKKCKDLKLKMRNEYRKWKRGENENIRLYLESKKSYKETVKQEEKLHFQNLQKLLKNVKHTRDFWNAIRQFRGKRSPKENNISLGEWEHYLLDLFDQNIEWDFPGNFQDARCKTLDAKVSMDELHEAILKMKSGKSPGPDGILSEQLKNLSIYWLNELRILFDDIMENNNVPQSLAKLDMVMIFKKGDKNLPENYRSIALLNNIFKIFTHILADRIYTWAEENSVINEGQMGFRRKRGCVDGIFVLSSIVHLRMRSMNRMVYAVFIDFQRAFSSVPHDKMWKALFKLGLSGNIIRTIATLYLNTRARKYIMEDENRRVLSSYSVIYKTIADGHTMKSYLNIDCPIQVTRTFSQLRAAGANRVYINLKGNIHSWNTTELCTMCNLAVLETLQHVICECPMYADVRSVFLKPILDQGNTLEQVLFNVDCSSMTSKLYAIHNFVCEAMKIRAFVSNQ